jgi:hypothetical protein
MAGCKNLQRQIIVKIIPKISICLLYNLCDCFYLFLWICYAIMILRSLYVIHIDLFLLHIRYTVKCKFNGLQFMNNPLCLLKSMRRLFVVCVYVSNIVLRDLMESPWDPNIRD